MNKHTLAVFRGEALVHILELTGQEVRIGRSPENQLVLTDDGKAVSRFHAEIRVDKHGYQVLDLHSQNGTWVDGERVERSPLKDGRDIVIGPYRIVVREGEFKDGELPPLAASGSQTFRQQQPASNIAAHLASVATQPALGPEPKAVRQASSPSQPPAPARVADKPTVARATWMSGRPVMYVGIAAIVVIAAAVALLLPKAQSASATGITPAPAAEAVPATPAAVTVPPNADEITRHLTEAQALIERGEYNRAVTEHLDPALALQPGQAEAVRLREQALQLAATGPVVEPPPVVEEATVPAPTPTAQKRPAPKRGEPLDPNALPRGEGESDADWKLRNAQTASAYQSASARLAQSDWVEAVKEWTALYDRYPAYRDVAARLEESRIGLQEAGRAAMEAGKAMQATDMPAALQQYERAMQHGVKDAAGAAAAVREQMQREGRNAIKSAKQFDTYGRVKDAVEYFERAVRYLPSGDPDRQYAEERLRRLRQDSEF
jgi:predicted component of type VI protein secretion system